MEDRVIPFKMLITVDEDLNSLLRVAEADAQLLLPLPDPLT